MFSNNYVRLCAEHNEHPTILAEKLGYSRAAGGKWANGSVPRSATLYKIADHFGITVDQLLDGDHAENRAEHNNGGIDGLSEFEKTVIALMRTNSEFKAQVDLAVELAKRKAVQNDG